MKKLYKYIVFIGLIWIIMLLIMSSKVNANTVKKITMDIYINEKGTAEVTEVWEANLTEGTEGYKPYGNLESYSITNFIVSDDTGRKYET